MKKILLCCGGGMSTSLLMQKMEKEAASRGFEVEIEAIPVSEVVEHMDGVGVILLGPQVAYAKGNFDQIAAERGIPVEVMAMTDYGRMNASRIMDLALRLMGE